MTSQHSARLCAPAATFTRQPPPSTNHPNHPKQPPNCPDPNTPQTLAVTLRTEVEGQGVHVGVVQPGLVKSNFMGEAGGELGAERALGGLRGR